MTSSIADARARSVAARVASAPSFEVARRLSSCSFTRRISITDALAALARSRTRREKAYCARKSVSVAVSHGLRLTVSGAVIVRPSATRRAV